MGVYHGYLVLLGTFLMSAISLGAFFASSMYLSEMKITFDGICPASALSFFITVQSVMGQVASMGGGPLQEALSAKGMNMQTQFIVFAGGSYLVGLMICSYATNLSVLLIGAMIAGIGYGVGGFVSLGVCVLWFNNNRGTMLLLAMSGRGFGSLGFSKFISGMITYFSEAGYDDPWRMAMRSHAVLSLAIGIVGALCFRLPLPGEVEAFEGTAEEPTPDAEGGGYGATEPATKAKKKKRRSSMAMSFADIQDARTCKGDGKKKKRSTRTSIVEFDALSSCPLDTEGMGSNSDLPEALRPEKPDIPFKEIALSRTSICIILWMLTSSFAFLNFNVHLPGYAVNVGMETSAAGTALGLFGIGLLAGYFTLGPVTDILGAKTVLIACTLGMAAIDFLWPSCDTPMKLNIAATIYGYSASTQGSHPLVLMADAFSHAPPAYVLMLNGIVNMMKIPGYFFGPMIAGILITNSGGYLSASFISMVAFLISTLCLLFIPTPKNDDKVDSDEMQPLTRVGE